MYQIYADTTLFYDDTLPEYVITKGQISRELNKSGSFVFTIYDTHPLYNFIVKLKTIITVYKNGALVFRGRAINEAIGFYKDKTYTCEGDLSFFLDSIQRPYTFGGTPAALLTQFINNHNEQVGADKRFIIGDITVTDPNNYISRANSNYQDTLTNLNDHLLNIEGGYFFVTYREGNAVLNYYDDMPFMSNQNIEFGENLLDFIRTNNADEIATGIIPLGAKIETADETADDVRLTIESVNDGKDFIIDETAAARYGVIMTVVTWDDVTIADNLLTKARAYLETLINQNITIEVSAVDLALIDRSIDSFKLGDYINIISRPHNLDDRFLLQKQTIDLLNSSNDTITLGKTYSTFTDTTLSANTSTAGLVQTVETINANYAVDSVVSSQIQSLESSINQTSESITSEILVDYVTNDQLTIEKASLYEQLVDSFEFSFSNIEQSINDTNDESRNGFAEIKKYIRFEDGKIFIGESNNELVLRIENDKISFLDNDVEVAYLSNNKLTITEANIITSLNIGNFAFIPRDNGNLSFKKVV